jgi:hypothetical protein
MLTEWSTEASPLLGTNIGFWLVMPSLNPVGHHSTRINEALAVISVNSPGAVVRHHVTLVQKSHCHILSSLRVADDHLVPRFKACQTVRLKGHLGRKDRRTHTLQGEILDLEALVSTAVTKDDRSIRD